MVDLVNKKLKNERLFPLLIKINKKLVNGQGFANKKILKNIENSKLDKSKYLRALALNGEIKNIDFTYLDNLIMEINRIGINIQKV